MISYLFYTETPEKHRTSRGILPINNENEYQSETLELSSAHRLWRAVAVFHIICDSNHKQSVRKGLGTYVSQAVRQKCLQITSN